MYYPGSLWSSIGFWPFGKPHTYFSDCLSSASETGVGHWMMTIMMMMMICSSEWSERGGSEGNWTSACVCRVQAALLETEACFFVISKLTAEWKHELYECHRGYNESNNYFCTKQTFLRIGLHVWRKSNIKKIVGNLGKYTSLSCKKVSDGTSHISVHSIWSYRQLA